MDRLLLLQARAEVMRLAEGPRARRPRSNARRSRSEAGARRTARCSTARTSTWCRSSRNTGWWCGSIPKDAPAALLYTTAGLLGHNGLNEAGVGICANFINDPADGATGFRAISSRGWLCGRTAPSGRSRPR